MTFKNLHEMITDKGKMNIKEHQVFFQSAALLGARKKVRHFADAHLCDSQRDELNDKLVSFVILILPRL